VTQPKVHTDLKQWQISSWHAFSMTAVYMHLSTFQAHVQLVVWKGKVCRLCCVL